MKKKLLLGSGILALASPFISATCVVKNKSENDNPAASPAPNPVTPPTTEPVTPPKTPPNTPPTTEPVTPPNTPPSVQPAPNPITPPATNPVTPPNTQPSNPPANDKLEKEQGKKHEEASAKLTADLFSDANGRSVESIKSRIYRDSISGLDIDRNPRRDKELEIASKIDNLIAIEDHNESSSESTLRLFDDTYTDAKNKALLEKAKRDVAESNDSVERNSRAIETGNWTGISKDEEEKLRKQLTDISESILNNDPDEWERKEEARIAWENAFTKEPFWNDISNRDWAKEYKESLGRKNELLAERLKKLEYKNNKEISAKSIENEKYIALLKSDLNDYKTALEKQKQEVEKQLASTSSQLDNPGVKEKLEQINSAIEDLNELLRDSENELDSYEADINYYDWLVGYGKSLRAQKTATETELSKLKELLKKLKQQLESKIKPINDRFDKNSKEVENLLKTEKDTKASEFNKLKEIYKEIDDYDKYWMYTFSSPKESITDKFEEITRISDHIRVLKASINDLVKLRSVIKINKSNSIDEVKKLFSKPLADKEAAIKKLEKDFKIIEAEDERVNVNISKINSQNEANKKERDLAKNDIENIGRALSELLYTSNIMSSELNKLGEDKKALESKSKEISEKLANLEEKEELIKHLEEIYNDQIEELEEKAYDSEKYLNDQIKKTEQEISKLK
ncbi:hypothetical protein NQV05_03215 [Mycoplasmopsis agalactiae]|uniref:lipoprotein, MAG6090 family n=1 Tax=Mycoplasmopsis agalactiae TaxID=2110 RepID=UPI00211C6F3F|nr:hypothetical protein [Mycoplasmopsis agalactiae]UUM25383.1 hypothetical protein NQV05_03215 [Mycoplasmopsis agalactiae]